MALLCATPAAAAQVHSLGLQGGAEFAQPVVGRLTASLDVGLPHGLGLRAMAGPAFGKAGVGGRLLLGPTWSFDATSWVPRVGALIGLRVPQTTVEALAGGELARYVSLHTSLTVGLWGAWRQERGFGGVVTLGVAHEL